MNEQRQYSESVLLGVTGLTKHFGKSGPSGLGGRAIVRAVDGVNLDIHHGETLALVGESGCGKTTTARLLFRLVPPTAGVIRFEGRDVSEYSRRETQAFRRDVQMVFQDPYRSLDPRMNVVRTVSEPLRIHRSYKEAGGRTWVNELLELVGLDPEHGSRLPHEFSGGQRQRIAIARALALRPKLLILDEPVSALDVSVQAQIVNLLRRLQRELGVSYLFISHDLAVVRALAHRICVMYLGRVMETASTIDIFTQPRHPYTQALLSAVPTPDPARRRSDRIVLSGDAPDPANPPPGCRFHTRCWKAGEECRTAEPGLEEAPPSHLTACHFAAPTNVLGLTSTPPSGEKGESS